MHTEIPVRVLSIFTVIHSLCKSKDRGNVLDQYDLEIVKSRIKSINSVRVGMDAAVRPAGSPETFSVHHCINHC